MDPDVVWCISIFERSFLTLGFVLANQHWKWLCISPPVPWFCELAWGVQSVETEMALPEFQNFMGLILESLVEDILHSCHFWRSQMSNYPLGSYLGGTGDWGGDWGFRVGIGFLRYFCFVSEESGLILVSFFLSGHVLPVAGATTVMASAI